YAINLEADVKAASNLYHIVISFLLTALVVWAVLQHQTKTTLSLNKAKDEAEKYTQLQTEFLANISHEIRTPLNGIVGLAELLRSSKSKEQTSEYLKTIRASGHLLSSIINDVLEVSKLEAHKIVLQHFTFRLESSIVNCVNITSTALASNEVVLHYSVDPKIPKYVMGDRNRLDQVLSNLLNNAIKFTKKGEINIVAKLLSEDEKHANVQFSISDTGIGISEDAQKRLFDRFYQVSSAKNRSYRGTGLGLAICKNLVELMGGTIEVQSEPNVGSTFSFTLEFDKSTEPISEPKEPNAIDLGHIKILVAEDNAINRMVITKMLDQFNISSVIALDGKEAVEKAISEKFDIILMDIQMPNMDGLEASQLIRKIKNITQPTIIALTANHSRDDIEKAKQSGMDDFLSKPLFIKDLESMLVKYATIKD
ncbi:MAG: ATP-binding protein, partial [Cyclobacteriaceae bacterium]